MAAGTPFLAETLSVSGDPIADLNEDLAADAATNLCNTLDNPVEAYFLA